MDCHNYVPSQTICTICGKEGIPIYRYKGGTRKKGHLKKLYCIYCKKETNHIEVRNKKDYNGFDEFIDFDVQNQKEAVSS